MLKRRKWLVVGIVLTLGALFAAAFVVVTVGLQGSRAYVFDTLPALTQKWDEALLRQHLNRNKFSDADVKRIAALGRKEMGKLKSFTVNRATFSSTNVDGKSYVRLCYSVPAVFEKDPEGSLAFYVAHIDGRWQVVDFDVNNPHERRNNLFKPAPASAFIMKGK